VAYTESNPGRPSACPLFATVFKMHVLLAPLTARHEPHVLLREHKSTPFPPAMDSLEQDSPLNPTDPPPLPPTHRWCVALRDCFSSIHFPEHGGFSTAGFLAPTAVLEVVNPYIYCERGCRGGQSIGECSRVVTVGKETEQ